MTLEEAEKLASAAVVQLSENFDCVQVMVSSLTEQNKTLCVKRGSGNWYARQGMAHEFITDDVSESQANAIAPKINGPDEGEKWK